MIEKVLALAVEVFEDQSVAEKWLRTPNYYYFQRSPREVVARGDGQLVVDFLTEKLGRAATS